MDEDRNGLAGLVEKIIKDLNQVLMNHELTEFDIVPLESTTNKSPVLYVETSLGLESWCVKHVYNYCYSELIRDFLTNPKRRLSRLSNLNFMRIYTLLNPTILINPDVTTLWNKRREMLDQQYIEFISELHFSKLVLTRKPKCNEAYAYRRFILKNLFRDFDVYGEEFMTDIISQELAICNMAADKCMNNYHAWEHRIWLMDISWAHRYSFNIIRLVYNEYKFITEWTSNHISDYSCFHYRQICIKILYKIDGRFTPIFEKLMKVNLRDNFTKVLADNMPSDPIVTPNVISMKTMTDDDLVTFLLGYSPGNCKCYATWNGTLRKLELLFYELVSNEDLLKYYSNHETIWYHRNFIMSEIILNIQEYMVIEKSMVKVTLAKNYHEVINRKNSCENCAEADLREHHKNVTSQKNDWYFTCPFFRSLMNYEKALIKDRRDTDKFCVRYENYLKYFEGRLCPIILSSFQSRAINACDRLNQSAVVTE